MNASRCLMDLYAYNAWANRRVFEVARDVDQAALEENAPGTLGTIADTLKHLGQVEDAYAHMLRDVPLEALGSPSQYTQRPLGWFAGRADQLGADYQDLLATAEDSFFDQPLRVPWFDFALTKADGLFQVLSHSAQHRAQVFSVLGERGIRVPDLDYVLFVRERAGRVRGDG